MKTSFRIILAVIAITFCCCEKDPTFEIRSIDDNVTKISNITALSAKVTISIVEIESGDYYNYNYDNLEVYYSTSSNPFIGSYKCARCTTDTMGMYIIYLSDLEPKTTYYYALQCGNQRGTVRSFTTKSIASPEGVAKIDLGLPSGIMWASCNVGASTPEEYGDYFAWGEVSPKFDYSWWGSYKYAYNSQKHRKEVTKYCINFGTGAGYDGKTILELADDAAHMNWGGNWRMPTKAETDELQNKCTWTWTENYNGTGIAGYIVSSKTNSNSIFLPAAGYRRGSSLYDVGSFVFYWSSSLDKDFSERAYRLGSGVSDRDCGGTVRPVCP